MCKSINNSIISGQFYKLFMTLTYTYRKTSKPRGLYTTRKNKKGSHCCLFLYDVNYVCKSIYNTVISGQFYKLFMTLTYTYRKTSKPRALYNARIHVKGSLCNLDLNDVNYRRKSINNTDIGDIL